MIKSEINIRKAGVEDAEGVARVHVDSWCTTYKGIMPDEYLKTLSYEKRARMWKRILSAETNEVYNRFIMWVVENGNGEAVGFASGGEKIKDDCGYKGELSGIYLLREYQRNGTGKTLLNIFAKEFLKLNVESMDLSVLALNSSKIFYEKMGAEKVLEKEVDIGGKTLIEIIYGWKNIRKLVKR